MKINKAKLDLILAKKCMGVLELAEISNVAKAILYKIGKPDANLRPISVGKIAKALEVDVTELIEQED